MAGSMSQLYPLVRNMNNKAKWGCTVVISHTEAKTYHLPQNIFTDQDQKGHKGSVCKDPT